jgi:hypothetical protein
MKTNRLFALLLAGVTGALLLAPENASAAALVQAQAQVQSSWRTQFDHFLAWRASSDHGTIVPLVNYLALAKAGLTGAGITIELDSLGLVGLQDAYDKGLLDPAEITIYKPSGDGASVSEPRHAVRAAEVIHMIAPDADIYICNDRNVRGIPRRRPKAISWRLTH